MEKTYTLVTSLFPNRNAAASACSALPEHGIRLEDVSIIGPKGELSLPPLEGGGGAHMPQHSAHPRAEGAAVGAMLGTAVGYIGGIGAMLIGLMTLPAMGLAIAGPLVGALVGAGLSHHDKTVVQALRHIGVSEADARRIEDHVKRGGILLTVAVDEERVQATEGVLEMLGGKLLAETPVTGRYGG